MASRMSVRMTVSSQFSPLNRASTAPPARANSAAHQAASRRERRPKASRIRIRPRIDETKWLTSIKGPGATASQIAKRVGSDGVAPEARSRMPALAASMADSVGATARKAGLSCGADIKTPDRRIPAGHVIVLFYSAPAPGWSPIA
jgi:hypothetical protein